MDALNLLDRWPVDHVAAGVICPDGTVITAGPQDMEFHLASISKPLTAWALLIGAEEGVMALDDQLVLAQPGCTLRHLLSHAGGYRFEGREPISAPEVTRIYSNSGFDLAVDEFSTRAGLSFAEYLDEAVFQPLAMSSSRLEGSGAHGVWSTASDLLAFAEELLRPRLLHHSTVSDATTSQFPGLAGIVPGVGHFAPCPWGLGVEIAGSKSPHWMGSSRSEFTFGHFGGSGTMMWVDPRSRCALIALTDRRFDQWARDALRFWATLSDAVIDQVGTTTAGGR
jgi:CubicO group peptidase (beta-lactamase class C family)